MTEPLRDPLFEMDRAVLCLALVVDEPIADDVKEKWLDVRTRLVEAERLLRLAQKNSAHSMACAGNDYEPCNCWQAKLAAFLGEDTP